MKIEDKKILDEIVKQISVLPNLVGIVQIGSSTYSEDYHDIDLIIFFDSFLVPIELEKIREKYKNKKFWVEGASVHYEGFNNGMKVFIKSFSTNKNKKILYGKDPFADTNIKIINEDVASYVWYRYRISEMYNLNYDLTFPNSIHAMLTYKNIFPENKENMLKLFKKSYPELSKFLPKFPERFLRETNKSNFKELYNFFEKSMEYFTGVKK
jgi:hypothetical protein